MQCARSTWWLFVAVGAVLAAQSGATLKELMARLGHSTPDAALLYQHASEERDQLLARRLSELAGKLPTDVRDLTGES